MNTLNIDKNGYDRMRPQRMADILKAESGAATADNGEQTEKNRGDLAKQKIAKRDFVEHDENSMLQQLSKTKFTLGHHFHQKFETKLRNGTLSSSIDAKLQQEFEIQRNLEDRQIKIELEADEKAKAKEI